MNTTQRKGAEEARNQLRRLLGKVGIDPNHEVMTPLKRPMKLVDNGKPVQELLG